jgi:hypothetical protein
MILPAWLTIHVIGYGAAALIVGGAGAYALHEHDAKIRAEDQAIAARDADTLRTRLMELAVNNASARVETVTVALRNVIQPTRVLVDSAKKYIHDTVLVKTALDSAKKTIAACSELILSCDQFRKMATDSLRVLGILLRQRDDAAIHAAAPPLPPLLSRGLQLGAGVCLDARKPTRGAPCVSLTYGFTLRTF